MTIYSVGYGGRTLEEVIGLLKQFCVTHVVDVRSCPYSKFADQFNREALEATTPLLGMKYVFMGEELGGRPDCRECYDGEGRVLYDQLRLQEFFLQGMRQLIKDASADGRRLCLLCSERKPEECHRSKLIGEVLSQEHVEVAHISENGHLLYQAQVMSRIGAAQPGLFGDAHQVSRKTYGGKKQP